MDALIQTEACVGGFAMNRYRQTRARTSVGSAMLVGLYDAAIQALQRSVAGIAGRDGLMRAHAFVAELQTSLDGTAEQSLCKDMSELYDYVLERIMRAYLDDDASLVKPALDALRELRAGWAELAEGTIR
jgi:flagellar secretion chaperone FliS